MFFWSKSNQNYDSQPQKNKRRIFILVIIGILIFGIGFRTGQIIDLRDLLRHKFPTTQVKEADLSLFWETWNALKEKYVDRTKLDYNKMVLGAAQGMVKAINDPYTVFLPPQESKRFLEDVGGSFDGIGAEIGIKNNFLIIVSPLKDTPAERAGLKPSDRILKINDKITDDLSVEEAVKLIRGPKGSSVTLFIDRPKIFKQPQEFKIVREKINVPPLKLEMKEGGIAYLRLYQFTANSVPAFQKAVQDVINSGNKKIILDLRSNPGGFLDAAVDIAGYFVPQGKVVVTEDFGNGIKQSFTSLGQAQFSKYSLVILVDNGSASASEILAGALRDNLGTILIGEKTFGKGSVQELVELAKGASLKVTVAKWLTPSGHNLNNDGLDPDIKIEQPELKEGEMPKDLQLEKAIEIISKK